MSLPKVEDAFEVWLANRHPGVTRPVKLRGDLHELARDAFLAGAEYGAAAGADHECHSSLDGTTTSDRPGESAKGGRADSPAGEAGNFFEPKPPTWCRVQAQNTTRSIACGYRYGHEGKHSWEEGLRADYFVMDEAAKMFPAGDKSPVCAAVQFAGGLPCTFPRGHDGGMHSWNFTWASRAAAS